MSNQQIDNDAAILRVSGDRDSMGKILDVTYGIKLILGMDRN